jgi:DNA replication protein DnaC
MIIEKTKQLAHQLRLHGIHASLERRANEALAGQMHPLEFLRLVLEDEHLARKDRIAKALATRAHFRSNAEIEDWDTTFERGVSRAKLKELAALGFHHNQENLILLGKTGEGKTHLAVALGRRLCAEGVKTLFMPVNRLFEEIAASKASGTYLKFIRGVNRTRTLILDDFGLRGYTHEEATALVDLLEERYRRGSLIVTSQVDPRGWLKLFEDPVIGEAIVDRIIHPSQKLVLKGGSYRERLSNASTKGAKADA